MSRRNPPWTRDELILALDLYFKENPLHTSQTNPKIVDLSIVLNKLPVHKNRPQEELFRNPNGVYMKMCNYIRLDPSNDAVGLRAGGKLEEVVWKEFANDR
jgi:5-methylcytosine-specific restriction enzyme A